MFFYFKEFATNVYHKFEVLKNQNNIMFKERNIVKNDI